MGDQYEYLYGAWCEQPEWFIVAGVILMKYMIVFLFDNLITNNVIFRYILTG